MGRIFGGNANVAGAFVPLASCSWDLGFIDNSSSDNIVLASFNINDEETIDIRRCFNEITHIFAFGRDVKMSVMGVTLLCFLGKKCGGSSTGYDELYKKAVKEYEEARIYKHTQTWNISIGDSGIQYRGFLVGMKIGSVHPVSYTCTITFNFLLDQGR